MALPSKITSPKRWSVMGFAINDAQNGDEHPRAKALKGFGGRSVLEVVDDIGIAALPRRGLPGE
jgi:hypothetical protein